MQIAVMFKTQIQMKWGLSAVLAYTVLLLGCAEQRNQQSFMTENIAYGGNFDTAYFGSGCFWCTEAVFQRLEGVVKVISGYGGGHIKNPTYEQVCDKNTGHAECCKILYDPSVISYDELLEVFWKTHDPTTPNQQGNDKGPQYRSIIFTTTASQLKLAKEYKQKLDAAGAFAKPIITEISSFTNFYPAELYHQNYYNENPDQMYCRFVVKPKIEKFEQVFKAKLKKSAN